MKISNSDADAMFQVLGRIYSVSIVEARGSGEKIAHVRIHSGKEKYVTVLLFGNFVDQIQADTEYLKLKAGDKDNPWIFVKGDISERTEIIGDAKLQRIALIGRKIIVLNEARDNEAVPSFIDSLSKEDKETNFIA